MYTFTTYLSLTLSPYLPSPSILPTPSITFYPAYLPCFSYPIYLYVFRIRFRKLRKQFQPSVEFLSLFATSVTLDLGPIGLCQLVHLFPLIYFLFTYTLYVYIYVYIIRIRYTYKFSYFDYK